LVDISIGIGGGHRTGAEVYRYVAQRVGLSPQFELQSPLPNGVLVYPTVLDDAVLYVFTSENAAPAQIAVRDKLTGAQISFVLAPERAAVRWFPKRDVPSSQSMDSDARYAELP